MMQLIPSWIWDLVIGLVIGFIFGFGIANIFRESVCNTCVLVDWYFANGQHKKPLLPLSHTRDAFPIRENNLRDDEVRG